MVGATAVGGGEGGNFCPDGGRSEFGTGGISNTDIAKKVYDGFSRLYKLNYIIPEYSDFATAIGAARRCIGG